MKKIEKAVVMPNFLRDSDYSTTRRVCAILHSNSIETYVSDHHKEAGIERVSYYRDDSFPSDADVIIVIGGDGSVLDAGKYAIEHGIALLGINRGHLGYLTQLEEKDIDTLSMLASGDYKISERMLLRAELDSLSGQSELPLSMNDFVFTHMRPGKMIYYEISDGGKSSLGYSSDSLVVSTPSGSTGYSLSGGGPVLASGIEAICVTPIASHSFGCGSIVFASDSVIKVKNTSDRDVDISLMSDGRDVATVSSGEVVSISVSDKKIKFISFDDSGTLDKLCKKMKMSNARYN